MFVTDRPLDGIMERSPCENETGHTMRYGSIRLTEITDPHVLRVLGEKLGGDHWHVYANPDEIGSRGYRSYPNSPEDFIFVYTCLAKIGGTIGVVYGNDPFTSELSVARVDIKERVVSERPVVRVVENGDLYLFTDAEGKAKERDDAILHRIREDDPRHSQFDMIFSTSGMTLNELIRICKKTVSYTAVYDFNNYKNWMSSQKSRFMHYPPEEVVLMSLEATCDQGESSDRRRHYGRAFLSERRVCAYFLYTRGCDEQTGHYGCTGRFIDNRCIGLMALVSKNRPGPRDRGGKK